MRTTINKKNWERVKDQYNDGITMPIIEKATEEAFNIIDSFAEKYAPKLEEAGMVKAEADIKVVGVLIAQGLQCIHDNLPEYYTREVITNIIFDIYDMIHMQVTDEELLGDNNRKS